MQNFWAEQSYIFSDHYLLISAKTIFPKVSGVWCKEVNLDNNQSKKAFNNLRPKHEAESFKNATKLIKKTFLIYAIKFLLTFYSC